MSVSKLLRKKFDSSLFCLKMRALEKWCVTKVAHCKTSNNQFGMIEEKERKKKERRKKEKKKERMEETQQKVKYPT